MVDLHQGSSPFSTVLYDEEVGIASIVPRASHILRSCHFLPVLRKRHVANVLRY